MPLFEFRGMDAPRLTGRYVDGKKYALPVLVVLALLLTGCGGFTSHVDASVTIDPLSSEDLAGACKYDIYFPAGLLRHHGILVVFERGDSSVLFHDVEVRRLASTLRFAMVFAHQCDAASFDDLQIDAAKGPGRALFEALNQFAIHTPHPELKSAKVVLYGFSAAGVLAAEMSSYAPDRVLGVLAYASGSKHTDLRGFTPSPAALAVPSLFLDSAEDDAAGTSRSLEYFVAGRKEGALWGFGVQNKISHCCNATTRPLFLSWLHDLTRVAVPSLSSGTTVSFICTPNGEFDSNDQENCSITAAAIRSPDAAQEASGWLPGTASAAGWLAWVTDPSPSSD